MFRGRELPSLLQQPPYWCCSCQVHQWLPLTATATSLSWLYLSLSIAHSFSRSFLLLDLWYHTLLDYVSLWWRQFSHFFCWPLLHYLSSNFWNVTSLHPNVLRFFCLFNLHCLPKWIQPILWLYMLIYPKFTSLALMSVLSSGNVATQHLMLDI